MNKSKKVFKKQNDYTFASVSLISISLQRNSWYDVSKSKKMIQSSKLIFPRHQIVNCILWWFSRIISKSLWELWVELRKSLAAVYFAFENVQYGKGKSSDYNSNFPHSQLCIIKRGQRPLPWLNFDCMYVPSSLLSG